jgi:hypothetical protein
MSSETKSWSEIQNYVYQANYVCGIRVDNVWFASVISCHKGCSPSVYMSEYWYSVCDYNGSLSVCDSVVILPMETAAIRYGLRSRNHDRRSSAQTVKLKPKQCRAEPLAFEDPPAGGWDGYLRYIRYAITRRGLIIMSVRPQADVHDNRARQLCICCGSRHDSGLRLRSSWTLCVFYIFFYYLVSCCPPALPVRWPW